MTRRKNGKRFSLDKVANEVFDAAWDDISCEILDQIDAPLMEQTSSQILEILSRRLDEHVWRVVENQTGSLVVSREDIWQDPLM